MRRPVPSAAGSRRRRLAVCGLLCASLGAAVAGHASDAGVEASLDRAFPGCPVQRRTVFLTEEQLGRARSLARVPIDRPLVYTYRVECRNAEPRFVYFDTHRVRTLPETLMIVIDEDAAVVSVEVLAFREPPDYLPRGRWYEQFPGRQLDERLDLKRGIDGVTGATLTVRATTDAVRRVLALHAVAMAAAGEGHEPSPQGTAP